MSIEFSSERRHPELVIHVEPSETIRIGKMYRYEESVHHKIQACIEKDSADFLRRWRAHGNENYSKLYENTHISEFEDLYISGSVSYAIKVIRSTFDDLKKPSFVHLYIREPNALRWQPLVELLSREPSVLTIYLDNCTMPKSVADAIYEIIKTHRNPHFFEMHAHFTTFV